MNARHRPCPARAWPLLVLLWLSASAHAAPTIATDTRDLTPAQAEASAALVDDVLARLPAQWASALGRPLQLTWRDDLPGGVHGRVRGDRIALRRSLLDGWMARAHDASDAAAAAELAGAPGSGTHAARAALLHELAHVYDRSPSGGLSRDPRLLDLAGWQVRPLAAGLRTRRSAFTDRSPDAYELAAPREFVAVNLEHFVLDPEYACRRPALHAYFSQRAGTPRATTPCAPDLPFVQADAGTDASPLLAIDPARVHAVDYLLADANARPMSRWGHSMLRLVVCAPGRPPGPDCRLDLAHHRVLSFRAFVDDLQISSWRGLTGDYPSRLFVLPLSHVVDEYTKVELRGLQSIPLQLSRDEIGTLLERAAQLHWSYDGRYYFVGNNCAVETFKLLHDGVPRLAAADLSSITPTGLLRRLARAGLADTGVLADAERAQRMGYYFEPLSARYQAMLDAARESLALPQSRAQEWLDLAPGERAPWIERADLRAGAALLLLEQAALRREQALARDALKRRLLGGGDRGLDAAALALGELLALEGLLSRPAALLPDSGYGVPQAAERAALAASGDERAMQWRRGSAQLHQQGRRWLTVEQRATLVAIEANVDALGRRVRTLHEQSGGVRLR
ncbi:MAG: DUF4105 domain-containing protein [Pseudomonas sp.]|nr:DUF4105 domain-containing protein [Pseudomonas sp.]